MQPRDQRRQPAYQRRPSAGRRTLVESGVLRENVLTLWSGGRTGPQIAHAMHIEHEYVQSIIKHSRAAGDRRAARRYAHARS